MNKLMKYFLVLSFMLPIVAISAYAQDVHLKKYVIGSGSMISSENGTNVRSSGTYGQVAAGKLEALGTAKTGDLYVGFWETTSLVGVEEPPFQGSVSTINNFPNPASEQTKIKYDLPESANISLRIYDLSGKLLKVIYSGFQNAGAQEVEYNLTDENGTKLTSGTYMYELSATPYNAAGGGFSPIHLRNAMIIQR